MRKLIQRHLCRTLVSEIQRVSTDVLHHPLPDNCLLNLAWGHPQQAGPTTPTNNGQEKTHAQNWSINEETFTVHQGAQNCFLGNTRPFHVLVRLAESQGGYLPIHTLSNDVWGTDRTTTNTIQRTISTLRRLLDEANITGICIDGSQQGHYCLVS